MGTGSGWAWDVTYLRFYDEADNLLTPDSASESGSLGGCPACNYGANSCVFGSLICGVRVGNDGLWVGAQWLSPMSVSRVSFVQPSSTHSAGDISIDCEQGSPAAWSVVQRITIAYTSEATSLTTPRWPVASRGTLS